MLAPLIGITSYARDHSELPSFSLPAGYVDCVASSGGVPVVIPAVTLESSHLLERLDGLILAGGGDVAPEAYGGERHETVYSVNEERDQCEFDLLRRALREPGLPILCICRGLQVLNVVLGGSLHVHLPERLGETVPHRIPPRETCRHRVVVEPQSRLGKILGRNEIEVLSWHHQGIDRLGKQLRAVAWADDGLVEAVEHVEHDWCIGVQWHPEMDPESEEQRQLFRAFVNAAMQRARRTHGRPT